MKFSSIFASVFVFFSLNSIAQTSGNCIEIEAILINACSANEGLNEQVLFSTGNSSLTLTDLQVSWPNTTNTWQGTCQNANTASLVAQMSANLGTCGTLLEPTNGVIPANQQVLLFSGIAPDVTGISFAGLSDTLYVVFHCGTTTTGNFSNSGPNLRTLIMGTGSAGCSDTVSYIPDQAPQQDGGAGLFNNDGVITYTTVGCGFFTNPLSAAWTAPATLCSSAAPINLNTLVNGSPFGTFSGQGVSDGFFNPAGLSGNAVISYVVGSGACIIENQQTITIQASGNPSWTSPGAICDQFTPVNFNDFITGTPGGTWTGFGLAGPLMFPEGINGPYQYTYSVGVGACISSSTQTIYIGPVLPGPSIQGGTNQQICNSGSQTPTITSNGYLSSAVQWYSNSALTNLIATGNTFNPTPGVNTTVYVSQTYPGCNVASTSVNITFIDQPAAPTVSPSQVNFCPGSPLPLLTATSTNSTIVWFNDQALTQSLGSGSTYQPLESQAPDIWVVSGPASCRSAATQVVLNGQQLSADWSAPSSVCSGSGNVNLAALVTGDAGGTFSGTGVTGNTFNPTGLSGSIQITYSVGSGSCIVSSAQTIQVSAGGNPDWTSPGTVCSGASPINLSLLITGDAGGTFSGTGVTGTTFNPTGLSGDIVITYQIGTGLCSEELAQTITITDGGNPAWTAPTSICSGAEPIDLSALVTGDAGGIFSGSGVSGSSFDPSGLTGSIVITYVVGSGSCIAESQQTINVLPGGDPSWISPGSLCNPTDPILLNDFITGTSGGTWSGQGVAGALFFPEGLNGPIQITYAVGSGQCAGQLAQTITIVSSINAPVVNPTVTYCQGQVATPINAGVLSGANITWYNDAALTIVLFEGNGFVPPANVSATYYVTQNVGDCASSASSVAVDFAPAPAVPTTTTDIVYCEGQAIPQLSATATGTITWYNDAGLTQVLGTGATYQPDNTVGSDVFVQTVEGNCASDAVEITLTEAAQVSADIDFEGNTATCNFQPVVLISPSSVGNLWSSGETTQSITITQAGTYTLTVTGTCNTAEAEVTFTDNGVNASFDLTEIEGLAPFTATATVTSVNADNSVFSLTGASISVSDNLPFTLENEGTYTLTLISSNDEGCIDSTSRLITVISGMLEVAIPNSFTPNGDGFNDLFKPVIKGLEEMNLIIFNRYGNQVASWKEGSVNWDGNHSGAASPDGVYFYVLMGKDYSGTEVERTGSLTIMR